MDLGQMLFDDRIGAEMTEFELQVPEGRLQEMAEDYVKDTNGIEREKAAFEAGARIRDGRSQDLRADLKVIADWKSPRSSGHILENSEQSIRDALNTALSANSTEETAVEKLTSLKGVGVPVASAILAAIYPEKYTVIDFRTLESLGHELVSVKFYVRYLQFCKSMAATLLERELLKVQTDYPGPTALRALDRALWQWPASKGRRDRPDSSQ